MNQSASGQEVPATLPEASRSLSRMATTGICEAGREAVAGSLPFKAYFAALQLST
jgi:hypothetical protein